MFDWLADETARIRTRNFHVIDGPLSEKQRDAVENSEMRVPDSYKQFVIRFGRAKLYRQGNVYRVEVFPVPIDMEASDGDAMLCFGRRDLGFAYFKEGDYHFGRESPVYELGDEGELLRTADGFEPWIREACDEVRARFSYARWKQIERGPLPFTPEEEMIIKARRKFRWRVSGIADNGDLRFEVYNGSDRILPFLSIGIRDRRGGLNGGVWLPVGDIGPGQTRMVEQDCYKKWIDPREVEAFEMPDPDPEIRDRYWEFRALSA